MSLREVPRVALAKIILKDPPLILADEPTASLDPKNSEDLLSILESLKLSSLMQHVVLLLLIIQI